MGSTTPRSRYDASFVQGFGQFLTDNLEAPGISPRHNLTLFAKELESRFGWPRLTLVNSGSSANLTAALALSEIHQTRILGIPLSDLHRAKTPLGTVLTAGFTFPSTMTSLQTAGFQLRLVDTEPDGFCMCPDALERAILDPKQQSKPVAVCVTHFLGFPAQLKRIQALCKAHGLLLLQDSCESMHLDVDGTPAHLFGDVSAWSFYHPHHLSSFGGGAVSSPHAEYRAICESITHWGRLCSCHYQDPQLCRAPAAMHHHFHYVRPGHNLEMSELNACFGRFQLLRWEQDERRRVRHYDLLLDALRDVRGARVWPRAAGCGSPFVFPVQLTAARGQDGAVDLGVVGSVQQALLEEGVEMRSLMGGGIHGQPAWATVPHDGLPHCKRMSQSSFFVGIHQTLKTPNVGIVASILHDTLSKILSSK